MKIYYNGKTEKNNMKVDVFIPVASMKLRLLPGSIYSAFSQTYEDTRVVVFLDGQFHKEFLERWWYNVNPTTRIEMRKWNNLELEIQYSENGVLVKNEKGPSGSAWLARQWLFEWEGKSDLVKMLDGDDILIPDAIKIMVSYYREGVDGIFCPLVRVAHHKFVNITNGEPKLGSSGSGSMMLHKNFMKKILDDGFEWPNAHDHDNAFFKFCEDKSYKFVKINENFLYVYFLGIQ